MHGWIDLPMKHIDTAHLWCVHYIQKRIGFCNKSKSKQPTRHLNAHAIEDLGRLVALRPSSC
jgi:hypothetical protein